MIDFIPKLQVTPDWKWVLYLFPALLFVPYVEVTVTSRNELIEKTWFWLCFGVCRRQSEIAYGEIENGKVTRGAS